ncbi:hypothetical protein SNEBB_003348 [Seison nebaliae]|nr:hypothetical protein SNEBB_003348 [Seison nebaliae]
MTLFVFQLIISLRRSTHPERTSEEMWSWLRIGAITTPLGVLDGKIHMRGHSWSFKQKWCDYVLNRKLRLLLRSDNKGQQKLLILIFFEHFLLSHCPGSMGHSTNRVSPHRIELTLE